MNHYQTLGVSPEAEGVVIRAAYRALSQRYHPDKCAAGDRETAHRRMSEINQAFHVLSDPALRAQYDRQHSNHSHAGETASQTRAEQQPLPGFHFGRQLAILSCTGLLILMFGIDKKPWWQWSWELVVGGFDKPSQYIYHWPVILTLLIIGAAMTVRCKRRSN